MSHAKGINGCLLYFLNLRLSDVFVNLSHSKLRLVSPTLARKKPSLLHDALCSFIFAVPFLCVSVNHAVIYLFHYLLSLYILLSFRETLAPPSCPSCPIQTLPTPETLGSKHCRCADKTKSGAAL